MSAVGGAIVGGRMRPDERRRVGRRILAADVVLVVVTMSVALLR